MVAPPSRRLARTPARLAADPLRGKGAYHRPLPRLSSSETPAADYNLNFKYSQNHRGRRAPSERASGRGFQLTLSKVSRRPDQGAPHMRRRAAVPAEPFVRLLEVAADDVGEFLELHNHV